jgi:hypothetical protein
MFTGHGSALLPTQKTNRMLDAVTCPPAQVRLIRHGSLRSRIDLYIRKIRSSLLDLRLAGDPWIIDQGDGTLALCVGDHSLAQIPGVALDLPSFNQRLDFVRHRPPRRRR